MWDHIRKNNLQNPQNKREIIANSTLKPIFGGKDRVSMFEMNSEHLEPPEVSVSASRFSKGIRFGGSPFLMWISHSATASPSPETIEPFLGYREAEMRWDGDKFLAVALFHPGRHGLDGMRQRVSSNRLEC